MYYNRIFQPRRISFFFMTFTETLYPFLSVFFFTAITRYHYHHNIALYTTFIFRTTRNYQHLKCVYIFFINVQNIRIYMYLRSEPLPRT